MGLSDILFGSKPQYTLLPGVQDSINQVQGMDFGLGLAGKQAKKTLKQLDAGEDVSNIGSFSPIRQEEAADLSDIDMDYMSGANALEGAAGGDQLNQINRMRDLAKENRRAQTGRQMVTALGDLRQSATNTFTNARQNWEAEATNWGVKLHIQGVLGVLHLVIGDMTSLSMLLSYTIPALQ